MFSKKTPRVVDHTFELIEAGSWDEARRALGEFSSAWIFRGQADATWELTTSLQREHFYLPLEQIEHRMLQMFKRRAHHFLEPNLLPGEGDDLSWLAIMQHFGAPTRLLDWTTSPYVGAYFAVENAQRDPARSAVWCIDQEWCQANSLTLLRKAGAPDAEGLSPSSSFSLPQLFDHYVLTGRYNIVVPVEPFRLNERMTTQQSLFLCPGDLDTTFYYSLREIGGVELPKHLVKITMPAAARTDALEELNQMNVNRGTLFPGIDGLAQSLKYHLVSEGDPNRPLRRAIRKVSVR